MLAGKHWRGSAMAVSHGEICGPAFFQLWSAAFAHSIDNLSKTGLPAPDQRKKNQWERKQP